MKRPSRGGKITRKRQRSKPSDSQPQDDLLVDLSNLSRRQIIERYHTIQKQIALLDTDPKFPNDAAREMRRQVLRAQLSLIGIETYQNASRAGEQLSGGFDSSKWVMKELETKRHQLFGNRESIRLLDVGAIAHRFPSELSDSDTTNEESCSSLALDVTSIDLNPENSEAGRKVIKADFFDFAADLLESKGDKFDVICLSLCVNFEGCPKRRGLMLYLASRIMNSDGMLYLVLPRACVENSRYFDEGSLDAVLSANNLDVVSTTYSARLMHSVSKRSAVSEICIDSWEFVGKKAVRSGGSRNNFLIQLDKSVVRDRAKADEKDGRGRSRKTVKKLRRVEAPGQKLAPKTIGFKKRTSNQRKKARRQAKR